MYLKHRKISLMQQTVKCNFILMMNLINSNIQRQLSPLIPITTFIFRDALLLDVYLIVRFSH